MGLPDNELLMVSERDIDLLVLEEITVSSAFQRWFAGAAGIDSQQATEFVGAWHSVTGAGLGESDLIFVWRSSSGNRFALLVENKIDAPAQPLQGTRYTLRGQAGLAEGDWDEFRTCIIAPARYLRSSAEARVYECEISYEQVRDAFLAQGEGLRSKYRARVIDCAIEKQRRGYSPEIDDTVTQFWHDFWRMSCDLAPRLSLKEPGPKPAGAGWIWTQPSELPSERSIVFKLELGLVDLQIERAADHVSAIDAVCVERLEGAARAVRTGKSASLRIEAAPIDLRKSVDEQSDQILEVFEVAIQLLDAWKLAGPDIEHCLEERTPAAEI